MARFTRANLLWFQLQCLSPPYGAIQWSPCFRLKLGHVTLSYYHHFTTRRLLRYRKARKIKQIFATRLPPHYESHVYWLYLAPIYNVGPIEMKETESVHKSINDTIYWRDNLDFYINNSILIVFL